MAKVLILFLCFLMAELPLLCRGTEASQEDLRVLDLAEKMESAFKSVQSYTCQVEQTFFKDGSEDQRSSFSYYFKRDGGIRVDFSHPYSTMTVIHLQGEEKATVIPVRTIPLVKFRFSIHDSILKTPAGQRIDQTDIGYFIRFILKNLQSTSQGEADFRENDREVEFSLWAMDYIRGEKIEKYRIQVSRISWLPTRIERYDREGSPIEKTVITDYRINMPLDGKLFHP